MREVYITRVSSFLPNRVVENDNMEQYLGLIGDKPSRTRSIVLRQNGIKKRYYALNEKQQITHSNAQLAKEAVVKLFVDNKIPKEISLLSCATSTPDQWIPSHASMVHGELENFPMEIFSSAGVCLTSLQALKICYSNILAGLHQNAVCVASEFPSPTLVSKFYDPEYEITILTCNKDFLWESVLERKKHRGGLQRIPFPTEIGRYAFINDSTKCDIENGIEIMCKLLTKKK